MSSKRNCICIYILHNIHLIWVIWLHFPDIIDKFSWIFYFWVTIGMATPTVAEARSPNKNGWRFHINTKRNDGLEEAQLHPIFVSIWKFLACFGYTVYMVTLGFHPERKKTSLHPGQVRMTFTHGSTRLQPDNDGEQKRRGAVAQCLGG